MGRWPDWSFYGEEFPPTERGDTEHRWLVDPIDGTTNFINGQHYTISMALRRGNQTVAGALYNPVSDEMFTAIPGQGAFMNGERLRVSQQADIGLFAIGTGLPTPNLSTGEHNPHSPLEWTSVEEMQRAVDVLVALAQLWGQETELKSAEIVDYAV